ncbi:TetR/AcrR family transcriptional regulator [Limnoglobus roseus]|uniref:TetR/AcrR family transcriptional regulator n=1 Tax=Limnoglobus roseus TaxID=2598579 RepID=A0A5C1A971_9BACT|nr:TetR/AcrR family transcriptional regulator [Limnoglobus roseus]QEL15085.1 TetR/AcrR family transcriptional regulator [Limnoglobus roseus]
MRVSRKQAEENREAILAAASRLFRESGFEGVGVDAVTRAAGLTHGGFYGHFASKDELVAEVCERALAKSLERWTALAQKGASLAPIVSHYLSAKHRDNPGEGCAMSALGTEAGRGSERVRRAFTAGVRPLLGVLTANSQENTESGRREDGLAMLATLVGAVVMARAVDDPDLSDEILNAASKSLGRGDTAR